jgi:hypothetical protein
VQVSAPFGRYTVAAQVLGFTDGETHHDSNLMERK